MSRPTVFLDRDGVLCIEKSYVTKCSELEIYPFAREAVELIHRCGYYAIVLTNQSAVARGMLDECELLRMNELLKQSIGVDDVFYCPHYPKGTNAKYAFECDCRKPKSGMIRAACSKYDIDLRRSYMVGDRVTDILLGENAGIKTVLVKTGYGLERLEADVKPDIICDDLLSFAQKEL